MYLRSCSEEGYMKNWSLLRKLLTMCVVIGAFVPALGFVSYLKLQEVSVLNRTISQVKLKKTKMLGELVFKFRDIRIQARTMPVRGLTQARVDEQAALTKTAMIAFIAANDQYEKEIENEKERQLFQEFKKGANDFLEFADSARALALSHDPEKMDTLAQLVRDVCPVKAGVVEVAITNLTEYQMTEAAALVASAQDTEQKANLFTVFGALIGFIVAILLGYFMARSISKQLQSLADALGHSSGEVTSAAGDVANNGNALSSAATEQAAALQETVSAIEQISSMIDKNSDNANLSKDSAHTSLNSARAGDQLVVELIREVEAIQTSTSALLASVNESNKEVKGIVEVIAQIESKTKVINDIVFQTKLLSFNASVEAARAGESGKGFAVVAEEVGNLAAMSGASAKEISDLLSNSVQMVDNIVSSMQRRVEKQANESRIRVENGISIGRRCGAALVEILSSVEKVEQMVSEISQASIEQSTGVSEVSKAMHQMDQVTQQNAEVSNSSAHSAAKLNAQAVQMKQLVDDLFETIHGKAA
jgi:methyl-accepting chemotaxis protein